MDTSLIKQLKKEEKYLLKQIKAAKKMRKKLEQRGCYTDKELAEKDRLLDEQERQIQVFQHKLLHIQRALRTGV